MGRGAGAAPNGAAGAALPPGRGRGDRRGRRRREPGSRVALTRLVVPERLPGIVDAHAHLQHDAFTTDLESVLDRARAAGVVRILVPGWDRASSEAALDLATRHAEVLDAAVGIHPHYVAVATDADWAAIEQLADEPAARAVGEIGLDFFRNLSPPDMQRDALARQLDLAARVGKPVVVHDRDAHAEVTSVLLEHATRDTRDTRDTHGTSAPRVPGVLHAFSGDEPMATALTAAGYLISFALPVSFRANHGPRAAAVALPAAHLLVETDSPYLGPAPDQRNEPTTVLRTASAVARLRNEPPEAVAAAANAAYFRLIGPSQPISP